MKKYKSKTLDEWFYVAEQAGINDSDGLPIYSFKEIELLKKYRENLTPVQNAKIYLMKKQLGTELVELIERFSHGEVYLAESAASNNEQIPKPSIQNLHGLDQPKHYYKKYTHREYGALAKENVHQIKKMLQSPRARVKK